MDRAEGAGLGLAVAGHVVLFALLSLAKVEPTEVVTPSAMEVEFFEEVALDAEAAPQTPSASRAPEIGPVEEPPPEPLPRMAAPEPLPPPPTPLPPPKPEPRAEAPKPVPKPAPVKKVVAQPRPSPSPTRKAAAPPKKTAPAPAPKVAAAQPKASPRKIAAPAPRASRIGKDFLKDIGSDPAPAKKAASQAPAMSEKAVADIGAAIKRQVQPCADRQVKPGPGVERIQVTVRLRLNKNGSLAGRPVVAGVSGDDDENSRYLERVKEMAVASFIGCAPLKGLPAELYDVPRGWKVFSLRFRPAA